MVLRGAGSSSDFGGAANVVIARMVIAIARTTPKINPSGVRAIISLLAPDRLDVAVAVLKSEPKRICDGRHTLVE
jgi:hypothetical protein